MTSGTFAFLVVPFKVDSQAVAPFEGTLAEWTPMTGVFTFTLLLLFLFFLVYSASAL